MKNKLKQFLNKKISITNFLLTILIVLTLFGIVINIIKLINETQFNKYQYEKEYLTQSFRYSKSDHRQFTQEYNEANKIFQFYVVNKDKMKPISLGTAFYYKDDTIITNYHNIICQEQEFNCGYFVIYQGGLIELEVIRLNSRIDLAALKTINNSFHLDNINICDEDVLLGEKIWSFGFGVPYTNFGSLKSGYISTNTRAFTLKEITGNNLNSIAHINIKSGDSGSPLFKKDLNCVFGVVNASNSVVDNITSYASYRHLINFLDEVEMYLSINKGEK